MNKKFIKIKRHPDYKRIVRKLLDGESLRNVSGWLEKKYPNNKAMCITTITLCKFRKECLSVDKQMKKDIELAKKQKINKQKENHDNKLMKEVHGSKLYRQAIEEIATTQLDVEKQMAQLHSVVDSRIEYWYDKLAQKECLPAEADKELRKYVEQQLVLLEKYKKLVEGMPDRTIEHNVNVNIMNDYVSALRDAIIEVASEFDTDVSIRLVSAISRKISRLNLSVDDTGRFIPAEIIE